jgi:hypothetical protein
MNNVGLKEDPLSSEGEFIEWLKRNKLQQYQKNLEEEGFEVLESLTLLSDEEVESLSTAMQMKLGHKKLFPVAIRKAREELKELEEKRKIEKEEQEKKRKRDMKDQEEKRKRNKAKQEKERAKRDREEEEQEKTIKMETELAEIERKRKLQQAKAQADVDELKEDTKSTTHNSTNEKVAKGKIESKGMDLPAIKSYAAFISHKKAHSKHGDSSETLARSLKVRIYVQ